jgi:hypothetical protein
VNKEFIDELVLGLLYETMMHGSILATRSTTKNFLVEPTFVEALAALQAVEFSREMRFYDAIVEGDALQFVNALRAKKQNWSNFRHIEDGIQECMRLLRSCKI